MAWKTCEFHRSAWRPPLGTCGLTENIFSTCRTKYLPDRALQVYRRCLQPPNRKPCHLRIPCHLLPIPIPRSSCAQTSFPLLLLLLLTNGHFVLCACGAPPITKWYDLSSNRPKSAFTGKKDVAPMEVSSTTVIRTTATYVCSLRDRWADRPRDRQTDSQTDTERERERERSM